MAFMKAFLWLVAGTLLLAVISIVFCNEWILKNDSVGIMRLLVYSFNPPPSLLAEEMIGASENTRSEVVLGYDNEYYGGYVIRLRYSKSNEIPYKKFHRIFVNYEVECTSESGGKVFSEGASVSWAYSLAFYSVPEDLPLGESVQCRVIISDAPVELMKYGPSSIVVLKIADK